MKKLVKLNLRYYIYWVLIALFFFGASITTKGQKKIEYTYFTKISKQNSQIADLTNKVKSECDESIKIQIDDSFLNVIFQSEFRAKANKITVATEKSIKKTQDILSPLSVENVKFYLLQQNEVPARYKMTDEIVEKDYFLYLWVFKNKEELNLDCHIEDKVCESIYAILPHELTHGAIAGLMHGEGTRWFEEGLGNYVGAEVSRSFRPSVMNDKFEKNLPKVSLHREDIRNSLWIWDFPTKSPEKRSKKYIKNEWYRYIASQSLIGVIVEESEKNGVKEPLTTLLSELVRQQKIQQRSATSEDLGKIIKDNLKVNLKELGVLDNESQISLVTEATEILIKPNSIESDKYYALNILASIKEIPLTAEVLTILLEKIYLNNEKPSFKELAATAIDIRNNQSELEVVIQTFLKNNAQLKKIRIKDVKSKIRELSIR